MAAPLPGTCSVWATEADLCSPCDDYDALGPIAGDFLQAASDVLYALSGRQFPGECEAQVRPCARRGAVTPSGWRRSWGFCGCASTDRCGCGGLSQIELGAYPITGVFEVKVDGVVLDADRYRVDDYRFLARLADADGTRQAWPCCQRLDLDDDQEETWSVTFTWGREPPPAGVKAAASLACELALACQPENAGECRLPKKVQSLTRQGVTMVMTDLTALLNADRTGIPEVDLFLKTYNPAGLRRGATVWSPGSAPVARHVGT